MVTTQGYVVIADLVGFSELPPLEQAAAVEEFLDVLRAAIQDAALEQFNLFPTGDGAILCLYEEGPPTPAAACLPLDFARGLLKQHSQSPHALRISVNYSSIETLVDVSSFEPIATQHLQVGNGINFAERALHFAEPREIIVTKQYWDRLFDSGVYRRYQFFDHPSVFAGKHMQPLNLLSYRPNAEEQKYMYEPPRHGEAHLKRYAYFPPLRADTITRFRELGLRYELEQVCRYAYDSVATLNAGRTLVSWEPIYDVLRRIPVGASDAVKVVSRSDRGDHFWLSPGSVPYLAHLERMASRGGFAQSRLFIFDPAVAKLIAPTHVIETLKTLHSAGSLLQLDKAFAQGSVILKYVFGITLFPALACAVAPIPVAASYDDYLETIEFSGRHDAVLRYSDREFGEETFRALIIADPDRVAELVDAYDALSTHHAVQIVS